jgi:hypothetical protein
MPDTGQPLGNQISQQRRFKRDNPMDDLKITQSEVSDSEELIWKFWAAIVETYSGTQLTREEDKLIALTGVIEELEKLIALTGVIEELEKLTGSQCLAGIWRRHLLLQLLWDVPKSEYCAVTRPIRPQAPSWS